jgi:uncharacterized protein YbjT (DUF2867 family)
MNVVLFGATGMVGQGVLRECLLDPEVKSVLSIGRGATGQQNEKLREIVYTDLGNLSTLEDQLQGYDACFFCLGVTSAGTSEADYRRVTYDITIGAAQTLSKLNPGMTFVYVSGLGADSTGTGRVMWARVKGQTENALFRLPFEAVYAFRPGFIQPLHGITSRTAAYRIFYRALGPLVPLVTRFWPQYATTTERLGRAMIQVARQGASKQLLESQDIDQILK